MRTPDQDLTPAMRVALSKVSGGREPGDAEAEQEIEAAEQRAQAKVISLAARRKAKAKASGVDGRSLKRKNPGTGVQDTSWETWGEMFRAFAADDGAQLTDIAKRFGVIYSAAIQRANREYWHYFREAKRAQAKEDAGGSPLDRNGYDPRWSWYLLSLRLARRYAHWGYHPYLPPLPPPPPEVWDPAKRPDLEAWRTHKPQPDEVRVVMDGDLVTIKAEAPCPTCGVFRKRHSEGSISR